MANSISKARNYKMSLKLLITAKEETKTTRVKSKALKNKVEEALIKLQNR